MHNQLEQYLTDVAGHLSPLPIARRNEELREIRQHLLNADFVNRELGQDEDEAAATAVDQFGPAEEMAEHLVRAWQRGERLQKRGFWGAAVCAVGAMYLFRHLTAPFMAPYFFSQEHPQVTWASFSLLAAWGALVFALAGAVSGLAFRRRSVLGTGFGLAAWSLCSTLHLTYALSQTIPHINILGSMVLNGLTDLSYIPAAMAGAWAGHRWQERRRLARR